MLFCAVCRGEFLREELIVHGRRDYFLCKPCKSDVNRLDRFGLSPSDYNFLLKIQGFKCAICDRSLKLKQYKFAVDHCHDSDDVRGILCKRCNSALGSFEDDPDFLVRAAEYLNNPPAMGRVKKHNGKKKIAFLRNEYLRMHGSERVITL
jgi:hypothetical protein